jgi:hypothetical protein
MDTGSSQSILQPRMSDSFRAWTCRDWLGTRAHWWGFKHCTLSLGGNCKQKKEINWCNTEKYTLMSMLFENAEQLVDVFILWHIHKHDCKTSISLFISVAQSVQLAKYFMLYARISKIRAIQLTYTWRPCFTPIF